MDKFTEQQQTISLEIDQKLYTILKGYTLATAITYAKGIDYRRTKTGKKRGPVCNMGVCYECSAFVKGKGFVRTCMLMAEDGMQISTEPQIEQSFTKRSPIGKGKEVSEDAKGNHQANQLSYDVVIIGAGPAGLSAAEELENSGLRIIVIDEQKQIGGQIYRHIPEEIRPEHKPNKLVVRAQGNTSVDWCLGHTVWSILPYNKFETVDNSGKDPAFYYIYLENKEKIRAKKLIIATGAYDYMIPFNGWTNPGVMSAGGLQIFAKTQDFLPGSEVLLTGSHPFLLIVAKEIIEAGGKVKGISFSQAFPNLSKMLKHGLNVSQMWQKKGELFKSLRVVRQQKIPFMFNTVPVHVDNDDEKKVVELQRLSKDGTFAASEPERIACDLIGACYGFLTSSEMPKQLGCTMDYDDSLGGHIVKVNEQMESSMKNVYVAGELTGVGGAELSEIEGRIAGLAVLSRFNDEAADESIDTTKTQVDERRKTRLQKQRQSWLSFARMLGEISAVDFDVVQILEHKPEATVCRCEEVSYETIKTLLEKHPHITSINALKLLSRCGMGLCQGRYCENTLLKIFQRKFTNHELDDLFVARFPSKALTINDLVD